MSNAVAAPNKSAAKFLRGRIRAVRAELKGLQSIYDSAREIGSKGLVHGNALDRRLSLQMTVLERDLADLTAKLARVA
jgi:hypothetical protein